MNQKILSICIPTYNRGEQLFSLIVNILKCSSMDFDIEITDNHSTDDTLEKIINIDDSRVIIHHNESNIGGVANMIKSIFNVKNKYAFYCNDRDSINYEKLSELIEFLKNHELSYIKVNERENGTLQNSYFKIYEKGFESLWKQGYTFHPTGCIFNCNLIRCNHLLAENYINWPGTEKYCKLAWDLMCFEDSAIFNNGAWNYASPEFYAGNISRFHLKQNKNPKIVYVHPSDRTKNMKWIMTYLLYENNYLIFNSEDERETIAIAIATEFYNNLKYYKFNASSIYETSHYQIPRHFVTTLELLKLYGVYTNEVVNTMRNCKVLDKTIRRWRGLNCNRVLRLIMESLFYDLYFIKKIACKEQW